MPQELQVLKCFNCEAFQVDIVKKVSKWCCKLCGEKQSIKKIYGKGSGKECRMFVQKLNEERLTKQMLEHPTIDDCESPLRQDSDFCDNNKTSKWSEFVEETNSTASSSSVRGFVKNELTSVKVSGALVPSNVSDNKLLGKVANELDNMFEDNIDNFDSLLDL